MKRRWKVAIGIGGLLAATILIPMAYIEVGCRSPIAGFDPGAPYTPILQPAERKPEARTFLTYPEWHIVYSAESYGRHLTAGRRPSGYAFGSDIGGFWSSYCALNRATAGGDAGDAKMMIYTIGISYSVAKAEGARFAHPAGRVLCLARRCQKRWMSRADEFRSRFKPGVIPMGTMSNLEVLMLLAVMITIAGAVMLTWR